MEVSDELLVVCLLRVATGTKDVYTVISPSLVVVTTSLVEYALVYEPV